MAKCVLVERQTHRSLFLLIFRLRVFFFLVSRLLQNSRYLSLVHTKDRANHDHEARYIHTEVQLSFGRDSLSQIQLRIPVDTEPPYRKPLLLLLYNAPAYRFRRLFHGINADYPRHCTTLDTDVAFSLTNYWTFSTSPNDSC